MTGTVALVTPWVGLVAAARRGPRSVACVALAMGAHARAGAAAAAVALTLQAAVYDVLVDGVAKFLSDFVLVPAREVRVLTVPLNVVDDPEGVYLFKGDVALPPSLHFCLDVPG